MEGALLQNQNNMAFVGQIFKNPITGETVEFLETANETGGQYTRFKTTIPQGKGFEVEHLHIAGDESFVIVRGTLSYKLNGKTYNAAAGEYVVLPKGIPHAHWNADAEDLVMLQTISPSMDIDRFLETLFGLAMEGKLDSKGQPPFLQVMVWIRHMQSKTYLAAIPRRVQDFLAFVLTPIASLMGYQPFYAKYEVVK